MEKKKFRRKRSIEEEIERLKKTLGLNLTGAPDITSEENPVETKKESDKGKSFTFQKASEITPKKSPIISQPSLKRKEVSIIKPLIYIACFLIFIILFLEFPILKYNTFLKTDNDFPEISLRGVFYYNIFGKKLKEYTILMIGNKKIVIPYSYEKYLNFSKENKILILKTYLPEEKF